MEHGKAEQRQSDHGPDARRDTLSRNQLAAIVVGLSGILGLGGKGAVSSITEKLDSHGLALARLEAGISAKDVATEKAELISATLQASLSEKVARIQESQAAMSVKLEELTRRVGAWESKQK